MKWLKAIVLLILLIFISSSFLIYKFFRISPEVYNQLNQLYLENQSLKSRLASNLPPAGGQYKIVKVYSSYPFNNRQEITVASGKKDGLQEGWPVMLEPDVFIGRITRVYEDYSLVRTIFDPDWRLSVRIGENGINALLVGGPEPRLTTIDKNKILEEGSAVYSADREIPYGTLIGKIKKIIIAPSAVFQEAELELPYELNNEIRELKVLVGYGK